MKKITRHLTGMILISIVFLGLAGCNKEESATLLVSEFRDYIEVKDGEGLFEHALVEDGTHWTVDDAANVVTMLKDDEDKNAEIMSVLAAQGQHYDAKGEKNKAYDLYDDVTKIGPFYINEVGGDYVIQVRTYDLTLVTEPGAEIEFLEETYTANEAGEVDLGKIGPGFYEVTGTLETSEGKVEKEETFFMFEYETFTQTEFLDFDTK